MTQLQQIEAAMLVPSGRPQTIPPPYPQRPERPRYVDRSSGKIWPSGGPLPFLATPLFQGWAR